MAVGLENSAWAVAPSNSKSDIDMLREAVAIDFDQKENPFGYEDYGQLLKRIQTGTLGKLRPDYLKNIYEFARKDFSSSPDLQYTARGSNLAREMEAALRFRQVYNGISQCDALNKIPDVRLAIINAAMDKNLEWQDTLDPYQLKSLPFDQALQEINKDGSLRQDSLGDGPFTKLDFIDAKYGFYQDPDDDSEKNDGKPHPLHLPYEKIYEQFGRESRFRKKIYFEGMAQALETMLSMHYRHLIPQVTRWSTPDQITESQKSPVLDYVDRICEKFCPEQMKAHLIQRGNSAWAERILPKGQEDAESIARKFNIAFIEMNDDLWEVRHYGWNVGSSWNPFEDYQPPTADYEIWYKKYFMAFQKFAHTDPDAELLYASETLQYDNFRLLIDNRRIVPLAPPDHWELNAEQITLAAESIFEKNIEFAHELNARYAKGYALEEHLNDLVVYAPKLVASVLMRYPSETNTLCGIAQYVKVAKENQRTLKTIKLVGALGSAAILSLIPYVGQELGYWEVNWALLGFALNLDFDFYLITEIGDWKDAQFNYRESINAMASRAQVAEQIPDLVEAKEIYTLATLHLMRDAALSLVAATSTIGRWVVPDVIEYARGTKTYEAIEGITTTTIKQTKNYFSEISEADGAAAKIRRIFTSPRSSYGRWIESVKSEPSEWLRFPTSKLFNLRRRIATLPQMLVYSVAFDYGLKRTLAWADQTMEEWHDDAINKFKSLPGGAYIFSLELAGGMSHYDVARYYDQHLQNLAIWRKNPKNILPRILETARVLKLSQSELEIWNQTAHADYEYALSGFFSADDPNWMTKAETEATAKLINDVPVKLADRLNKLSDDDRTFEISLLNRAYDPLVKMGNYTDVELWYELVHSNDLVAITLSNAMQTQQQEQEKYDALESSFQTISDSGAAQESGKNLFPEPDPTLYLDAEQALSLFAKYKNDPAGYLKRRSKILAALPREYWDLVNRPDFYNIYPFNFQSAPKKIPTIINDEVDVWKIMLSDKRFTDLVDRYRNKVNSPLSIVKAAIIRIHGYTSLFTWIDQHPGSHVASPEDFDNLKKIAENLGTDLDITNAQQIDSFIQAVKDAASTNGVK